MTDILYSNSKSIWFVKGALTVAVKNISHCRNFALYGTVLTSHHDSMVVAFLELET